MLVLISLYKLVLLYKLQTLIKYVKCLVQCTTIHRIWFHYDSMNASKVMKWFMRIFEFPEKLGTRLVAFPILLLLKAHWKTKRFLLNNILNRRPCDIFKFFQKLSFSKSFKQCSTLQFRYFFLKRRVNSWFFYFLFKFIDQNIV